MTSISDLTRRWFDKALEIAESRNAHYANETDPLLNFVRQAYLMRCLPSEACYSMIASKIARLMELEAKGAATEEEWGYLVDTGVDLLNYLSYFLTLTERERRDV